MYEFISMSLDRKKLCTNTKYLENFIITLTYDSAFIMPKTELVEIDTVPGGPFVPENTPLFIGKIRSELK